MAERKPEKKKEKTKTKKTFPMWIIPILAFALLIFTCAFFASQVVSFTKAGTHSEETVFDAIVKGYNAGKKEGLSAKDTELQMKNTVDEIGKLEVLVANVKIPEYHSVGQKYAAMYLFRGSAVFTVDLTKANINVNDNNTDIQVLIPKPVAEVRIDNKETERIIHRAAKIFNGSTEDGLEAYLNTLKAVDQVSTERISNYSELSEMAKQAAKLQLQDIIKNICGNGKNITFSFIEE